MKKSKFTDSQVMGALRRMELVLAVSESNATGKAGSI